VTSDRPASAATSQPRFHSVLADGSELAWAGLARHGPVADVVSQDASH